MTLPGERAFEDVIKDLEMRSSWSLRVGPTPMTSVLGGKRAVTCRRRPREHGGRAQVSSDGPRHDKDASEPRSRERQDADGPQPPKAPALPAPDAGT